jgi:hypothetical protein
MSIEPTYNNYVSYYGQCGYDLMRVIPYSE